MPSPSLMSLNALAAGELVLEIQRRIAGMKEKDLIQIAHMSGQAIIFTDIERELSGTCGVCSAACA